MKSRHETIVEVQQAIEAELARQGVDAGELNTFALANVASAKTMACFAADMSEEMAKVHPEAAKGIAGAADQLKKESAVNG